MKKQIVSIIGALYLISIGSCQLIEPEPELGKGSVSFRIDLPTENLQKTPSSSDNYRNIILSITDDQGHPVIERNIYPLLDFSGQYMTSPISLPEGVFYLTEFFVTNDSSQVLLAAPVKGSLLSELVDQPLPLRFSIEADKVTHINPEVLSAENQVPEVFGYSAFSFIIREYILFHVSVFSNTEPKNSYKLIDAEILCKSDTDTLFKGRTEGKTVKVAFRTNTDSVNIIISAPGFNEKSLKFLTSELKQYSENPLIVILEPSDNTDHLVLYLPINDNLSDESSLKQEIIILGNPTIGEGKTGKGIHFMGENDGLVITNSPSLNPPSITVSAYVKIPDSFFGIGNNALISKGAPKHEDPYYQFHLGISGDLYYPYRGYASASFCVGNHYYHPLGSPNSIWQVGEWNLFTGVFDASTRELFLYLNGELISKEKTELQLQDLGQDIYIARFGNLPISTPVWMDDIRIYNKALSQNEINELAKGE